MTELPPELAAHRDWLAGASTRDLDAALQAQRQADPEGTAATDAALDAAFAVSWSADIPIGYSVNASDAYVEVPLDEEDFLEALGAVGSGPALVRLNVTPDDLGSQLDVDLLLGGAARHGKRVKVEYALEGEDVVLRPAADDSRLSASSRTAQRLAENDAVTLRLVIENEDVA